MQNKIWGMMLLGAVWAGPALAVSADGHEVPYVAAQYAHEFSDSSRASSGGNGYQLTFGWPLSLPNTAVEGFYYDVGRARNIDGKKDYQTVFGADLVRDFGLMSIGGDFGSRYLPRFKPFGLAGLEAVHEDVRGERKWHPAGNLGAGLLFPLPWYGAAVRTEGRVQIQGNKTSVAGENVLLDYRLTIGIQIPLTPLFKDRPAPKASECNVQVISLNGVSRKDCGADSDHDGVPDSRDVCPGTPEGAAVNADGCPVEEAYVLKGVHFDNDSAVLEDDAKKILDEVVVTLQAQGESRVEIAGYTDSTATPSYNLELSNQRAEAVRQYLVAKGIAPDRLTVRGYGEANPRENNDSEEGREANRRVEIRLVK